MSSKSTSGETQSKSKKHGGRWLAANPSKRWCEIFFLYYSIYWMGLMVIVVATRMYEYFGNVEYCTLAALVGVPSVLYPLLFPGTVDRNLPIIQRYWLKANIWIAIISFIGNYFWTHYFYTVLKAHYTFPAPWELNKVPIYLYVITHAYFCSYHTFSTLLLRRLRTSRFYTSLQKSNRSLLLLLINVIVVVVMSDIVAFMEAFTISSVPYYTYPNRFLMYTVGSVFYGIYFYVSFPMYYRLDETPGEPSWSVGRTAIDSLASCMLVTLLLDFWRLALGPIIEGPAVLRPEQSVPFVY